MGMLWHEQLNSFLMEHNLSVIHKLDVEAIIDIVNSLSI